METGATYLSLNQQTKKAGDQISAPILQGTWSIHYTMAGLTSS